MNRFIACGVGLLIWGFIIIAAAYIYISIHGASMEQPAWVTTIGLLFGGTLLLTGFLALFYGLVYRHRVRPKKLRKME